MLGEFFCRGAKVSCVKASFAGDFATAHATSRTHSVAFPRTGDIKTGPYGVMCVPHVLAHPPVVCVDHRRCCVQDKYANAYCSRSRPAATSQSTFGHSARSSMRKRRLCRKSNLVGVSPCGAVTSLRHRKTDGPHSL